MAEQRSGVVLSKTEFIRGLDCERRVWLDRFRPELRPVRSLAVLERMETGKALGELARLRYPDGRLVRSESRNRLDLVRQTNLDIEAGSSCLFEAAFLFKDWYARTDVISKTESGGWILDEVKSSSVKEPAKLDDDKVLDLAFQVLVAKGCGVDIESARLVLVDTSYKWDGGDYDPHAMLGAVDLTERCIEEESRVETRATELVEVLRSEALPAVETNTHCKKCDYFEFCHEARSRHDVIHLPSISPKAVRELRGKGFESIDQIPGDFKMTESRQRMRDVVATGDPFVSAELKEALDAIPFPAAFIDYESSNPAFPTYEGTRPYQQVCFQWSAHTLSSASADPVHSEYLPTDAIDPRAKFCETLWRVIEPCSSIVHYTDFEITQLKMMARDKIPYAEELLAAIEARTVDLEKIVSKHVYLLAFGGRTSIKVVLPALVPGMSYKDLAIADGTAAAASFRRMVRSDTESEEAASIREALLEYCCQDTLAMVEIFRALRLLAARRLES